MGFQTGSSPEEGANSSSSNPLVPSRRDLSNRKLARNQTELSRQIAELKGTVEAQGEMLRILLERLTPEGAEKLRGEVSEHGGRGWTR
jgi:hypothetical protein